MLALRLYMEFSEDSCREASSVLRSLVGPVRAEPGCRSTRLLSGVGADCSLTWIEEWASIGDFEHRIRSPAFKRILAVIELASAPPDVEIDDVAARRGFELVEEILGVAPAGSAEANAG